MRPGILCKLEKGVLIDTQRGFVDTFNWIVDFCNNIQGDGNIDGGKKLRISLDKSQDDHPVIRVSGEATGGGSSFAGGDGISIETIETPSGSSSPVANVGKAQIKGWNAGSPATNDTLADSVMGDTASGATLVVRLYDGSLAFMPLGIFDKKDFTYDDTDLAQFVGTDDIDIGMKTLAAGKGISLKVSDDGMTITVSATGDATGTQGFTGTRMTLADSDYDTYSHTLRKRFFTEQWSKGVMTSSTLGDWVVYHTAVEETVVVQDTSSGNERQDGGNG